MHHPNLNHDKLQPENLDAALTEYQTVPVQSNG